MSAYEGLPKLREWLAGQGFQFAPVQFKDGIVECDWYAYKRSKIPARACECNDDKVGQQIVVRPSAFTWDGRTSETAEVDMYGEYDGVWWKLKAYSISAADLPARLADVEASLIAAWNALNRNRIASDGTTGEAK